ncbi:hypothetical protein [Orgyia pseudotsugata single capsid nuclopolyhedrovirus]|nr:hypothetical protein [Orgyia pseudotsugata single capsid nuclopolyhedrovirus]
MKGVTTQRRRSFIKILVVYQILWLKLVVFDCVKHFKSLIEMLFCGCSNILVKCCLSFYCTRRWRRCLV